jgi:hypothetical protein
MKHFPYAAFAVFVLLFSNSCERSYAFRTDDPLAYYNYIDEAVNYAGKIILDFAGAAGSPQPDCRLLGESHAKAVEGLKQSQEKLVGAAPFPQSEAFGESAVALVSFHLEYIGRSYRRWIELRCKPQPTPAERLEMEKIGGEYRDGLYGPDQAYQSARARFIADHQLPVVFPHVQGEGYQDLN